MLTTESLLLTVAMLAGPLEVPSTSVSIRQSQGWQITQTENFRFCSRDAAADFRDLGVDCESLRKSLQETWFGKSNGTAWMPRCDVILHNSLQDYQRAIGPEAGQSVGCATVKFDGDRIVQRRIDVRIDAHNWSNDALPHELTHIVIAERFGNRRIPSWANEGMSVLAETKSKRRKRVAAFQRARNAGTTFGIGELMATNRVNHPAYLDAFYWQSAALVAHLVEQGTPAQFVEFLETAMEHSNDHALRTVYEIDGTIPLDRAWENNSEHSTSGVARKLATASTNYLISGK